MQQPTTQTFYTGPDFTPVHSMFATDLPVFDAHRQASHWPSGEVTCSPALFGLTATDTWTINNNHMSDFHSISSSPTSFEHNFVSSPEAVTQSFSADHQHNHPQRNALQRSETWKSINSERSSSLSSANDVGPECYTKQESETAAKPQRRRRKNIDPKQRHADKLEKNRKAAERCRQKQRSYVSTLQERAREEEIKRARLIAQVSQLRDDILSLKESMVSHSGCNDVRIKQYLLSELQKSTQRRTSSMSSMSNSPMSPPLHHEMLQQQIS